MTPGPWFIGKHASVDTTPPYGRVRKNRYERDGLTNVRDTAIDPDRPIRLNPREWLRVRNKSRTVAWVHTVDDALVIIAAPKLYVALVAVHEAIRFPRGVTEGEWIALRKQVGDVVCTLAPIFDSL